ncbi:hypothetical protein BK662_03190 [Pseudomonas frederiksbergensis]|uniref:Uncharacterized protein n=1 Tax=Pseudomonas frederiksbergensis TaxID=104087 RepID=A0A423I1G3_9PSED|nr:hypothetical protein BK662_03190 [Pseudomonas frederiksbergensis]
MRIFDARNLEVPAIPCGSGLARESGVSGNINVGCVAAFASKPAPTLDQLRFPDKNTRTLSGAMIGVNCVQACEEFP